MSENLELEVYAGDTGKKESAQDEIDSYQSPLCKNDDFTEEPIDSPKYHHPVDTKISMIQKTLGNLLSFGESTNKYDQPMPLNLDTTETISGYNAKAKMSKRIENYEEDDTIVSGFVPQSFKSPNRPKNVSEECNASCGFISSPDDAFLGNIDVINACGDVQSEDASSGVFEEATFSSMLTSKLQEYLPGPQTSYLTDRYIEEEKKDEPELIVKPALPSKKQRSSSHHGTNILKPKKTPREQIIVPPIGPDNWVTKHKPFLVTPPVVQLLPATEKTKHQALPQGMSMRSSSAGRVESMYRQRANFRPVPQRGHIVTRKF